MAIKAFFRRLLSLIKKEFSQLFRDQSSILIGLVLPIIMILIIGYGISLDVKKVPVAVVLEELSPTTRSVLSFLEGSEYFDPTYTFSLAEAEKLMNARKVDAVLKVPADFSRRLFRGQAEVQLILHGVDAASAQIIDGYVAAALNQWIARQMPAAKAIVVENRIWFNEANSSTWYFIPGLVVLITTLVGVFLTALVMAREWERGTLEALFVTPVKPLEILLSKIIPYYVIAMLGLILCLIAARFLYEVPIRGSLFLVFFSATIYLLVVLGMGLVISSITKNQFIACQLALLVSFLPATMLSGFIFDLRSVPLFIRLVGQVLPATYYMELNKSLFLAGNDWELIRKNCTILSLYALFFLSLAWKVTKKRID